MTDIIIENSKIPKIELRSEEVQELMDKKPSIILRFGIGVVLFILCCAFATSKYIPYPDELEMDIILYPNVNNKKYINTNDSEVLFIMSNLEQKVKCNDTLGIFACGGDTTVFCSPYNGFAYRSYNCNSGDMIKAGSLTILVSDCDEQSPYIIASSSVDEENIKKIHSGMVMTTNGGKERYSVKEISLIPDTKGMYTVVFTRAARGQEKLLIQEKMTGKVILDNTNVYDKFFAQGIKKIIKF